MALSNRSEVYLGRQPILDRHGQLFAYELLFRNSMQNAATVTSDVQATATVISNVFAELSLTDALGPYRGFINVDENLLFSDVLELLPREAVVLELLETINVTPEVIARAHELKASGFTLALDDIVQLNDGYAPLLPAITYVKVDLKPISRDEITALARRIHAAGLKALAEKVDSRDEMEFCHALGFDLFQGYYFAKPVIITGKKLDHSQLALLRLMNLLLADADTVEIEQVFKHEPGLTLNLLRLTNSVACGLPVRVTSLKHAITVLGRRQLQRWLQLLLFAAGQEKGLNPLLPLAATRGRLMELLSERIAPNDKGFADNAFLVGILSLTPTLLSQPMPEIIQGLSLGQDVQEALLEKTGRYGYLLQVVELLEEDDLESVEIILPTLPGLRLQDIPARLSQAMAWANNIGREAN